MGITKNQLFNTVEIVKEYVDEKISPVMICGFGFSEGEDGWVNVEHLFDVPIETVKNSLFIVVHIDISCSEDLPEATDIIIPTLSIISQTTHPYYGTAVIHKTRVSTDGSSRSIAGVAYVHFSLTANSFKITGLSIPTFDELSTPEADQMDTIDTTGGSVDLSESEEASGETGEVVEEDSAVATESCNFVMVKIYGYVRSHPVSLEIIPPRTENPGVGGVA